MNEKTKKTLDSIIAQTKNEPLGTFIYVITPRFNHQLIETYVMQELSVNSRIKIVDEKQFIQAIHPFFKPTKNKLDVILEIKKHESKLQILGQSCTQPSHLELLYNGIIEYRLYQYQYTHKSLLKQKIEDIQYLNDLFKNDVLTHFEYLNQIDFSNIEYFVIGFDQLDPYFSQFLNVNFCLDEKTNEPWKFDLIKLNSFRFETDEIQSVIENLDIRSLSDTLIITPNNEYLKRMVNQLSNNYIPYQATSTINFNESNIGQLVTGVLIENNYNHYLLQENLKKLNFNAEGTINDYSKTLVTWMQESIRTDVLQEIDAFFIGELIQLMNSLKQKMFVTKEFYCQLFNRLASNIKRSDQGYVNGVHLCTVDKLYNYRFKKVFIIGFTYDNYPSIVSTQSIFNIEDLDKIQVNGSTPFSRKQRLDMEQIQLEHLMMIGDSIMISYTKSTLDGKPKSPSKFIKIMTERISNLKTNEISPFEARKTIKQVRNHVLFNRLENIEIIEEESIKPTFNQATLNGEVANDLISHRNAASISAVELFNKCPFAHFMKYSIKPVVKMDEGLTPVVIGNMTHFVLEKLYSDFIKKDSLNLEDKEMINETMLQYLKETYSTLLPLSPLDTLMFNQVHMSIFHSFTALIYQFNQGHFKTLALEKEISITLFDHPFQGVIDRIDLFVNDNICYVSIIDYKTGNKDINLNSVLLGTDVQLIIYLKMVIEIFQTQYESVKVAGAFYFYVHSPILDGQTASEKKFFESYVYRGYVVEDAQIVDLYNGDGKVVKGSLKKDGQLAARGNYLDGDAYMRLIDLALEKVFETLQSINAGNIQISPLESEGHVLCDYCEYALACLKDKQLNQHRLALSKKDKDIIEELGVKDSGETI